MSSMSTRKTLNAVNEVVTKLYAPDQAKEAGRRTKLAIRATAGKMNSANGKLFAEDEIARIRDPELRQNAFLALVAGHREQVGEFPRPWAHPSGRFEKMAQRLGVTALPLPDNYADYADWSNPIR